MLMMINRFISKCSAPKIVGHICVHIIPPRPMRSSPVLWQDWAYCDYTIRWTTRYCITPWTYAVRCWDTRWPRKSWTRKDFSSEYWKNIQYTRCIVVNFSNMGICRRLCCNMGKAQGGKDYHQKCDLLPEGKAAAHFLRRMVEDFILFHSCSLWRIHSCRSCSILLSRSSNLRTWRFNSMCQKWFCPMRRRCWPWSLVVAPNSWISSG